MRQMFYVYKLRGVAGGYEGLSIWPHLYHTIGSPFFIVIRTRPSLNRFSKYRSISSCETWSFDDKSDLKEFQSASSPLVESSSKIRASIGVISERIRG